MAQTASAADKPRTLIVHATRTRRALGIDQARRAFPRTRHAVIACLQAFRRSGATAHARFASRPLRQNDCRGLTHRKQRRPRPAGFPSRIAAF